MRGMIIRWRKRKNRWCVNKSREVDYWLMEESDKVKRDQY